MGGLNNRIYFLMVLGSRCWQIQFLVRALSGLQMVTSHCIFPLCEGGERSLVSLPLLIRTPILWDQGLTFMTSFNLNYLPESLIPKYSYMVCGRGVELQHMSFRGGGQNLVHGN